MAQQLAMRFPAVSKQQIGKVVAQLSRAMPIQDAWDSGPPSEKLTRQDIPRQPNLPSAYRYIVDVEFLGQRSGDSRWRTLVIDSDQNLSRDQLQVRARTLARDLFDQPRDAYDRAITYRPNQRVSVSVILVTRRS